MLIGKCDDGTLVDAFSANKNCEYFCPHCGEKLVLRQGHVMIWHFAHKAGSDCVGGKYEPMTKWHADWQREFPAGCREVVHKNPDGGFRRADVMLGDTVLEFQHSRISDDDWWDRNSFYGDSGKTVIWIYDRTDKGDFSDLRYYADAAHFGCKSLINGEFSLSHACWGSRHPVVLDYGAKVVVLWNFVQDSDGAKGDEAPDWHACEVGSVATEMMVFTRKRFVETITKLCLMGVDMDMEFSDKMSESAIFDAMARQSFEDFGLMRKWYAFYGKNVIGYERWLVKDRYRSRYFTGFRNDKYFSGLLCRAKFFGSPGEDDVNYVARFLNKKYLDSGEIDVFIVELDGHEMVQLLLCPSYSKSGWY